MKQIVMSLAATARPCSLLAAPARAEEVKAGDLVITQAWSRATPGGAKIGGGYLTIENKGSAPDRLIGGSADIAGKVEVHEMAMNNGVMTMRPLDKGLTIEPGKTVKLAPGGYHLMLLDLKSPLKQGDKLPVTLEFEKAGKVTLSLDVQGVGAQVPPARTFRRSHGHEEDARSFRHEDVRGRPARPSALAIAKPAWRNDLTRRLLRRASGHGFPDRRLTVLRPNRAGSNGSAKQPEMRCLAAFCRSRPCVFAPDPVSLLASRARPIPLV